MHNLSVAKLIEFSRFLRKINSSETLPETLQFVADSVASFLALPRVILFQVDPATAELIPIGSHELDELAQEIQPRFAMGAGMVGWVAQRRMPLAVEKIASDARHVPRGLIAKAGLESFAGVPLLAGERLVGVLAVFTLERRTFTQLDLDLLAAFADAAALVIEKAYLLDAERDRASRFDALSRQSANLGNSLDQVDICRMVVRDAATLFGASSARLWLYDVKDEEARLGASYGEGEDELRNFAFKFGEGVVGWVMQHRQAVALTDAATDPRFRLSNLVKNLGFQSYAVAPLLCDDDVSGALVLAHYERRVFSHDELSMLSILANQAAIALKNARLFRELQVAQEALAQTEKMSALGLMVSGITHELNNPLTAIAGNAHLLKQHQGPTLEREKRLDTIIQGVERCSRIVRSLLAFARKSPPEKTIVNVKQIIDELLELRRNDATRRNIALRTELADTHENIFADGHQLQQVFLNLLMNAEQSIGEDGAITLRLRKEGDVIVFEVEDTGCGMPPEVMKRIFDPFYTTKPEGVGTGLGLAVSQGIIESHDGAIEVESIVGKGTTFRVTLPAGAPSRRVNQRRGQSKPGDEPASNGAPYQVLIVDDDELVAHTLSEQLKSRGVDASIATSASAANRLLDHERFHALIVDIYLQGESGVNFIENVWLKHPSYRNRALLITGELREHSDVQVNGGTLQILTKPFPIEKLTVAIARMG